MRSSQNCITLQGSHYSQATVGLNVAVNPVQLISARMSVQTITEHHPRCEGRRIISKAGRRRTPSSVRAPRRIKASSARFHPHWPRPLRGPIDRHRGRAREAPQEALSADDVGRMTSEAALSKHPKGGGSRPITPQNEVSENDNTKLYLFYANLAWRQSRLLRDPFAFGSFKHRFAIFKNPPRPGKDGDIDLSQRPGLGVEINQDLIITA